MDTTTPRRTLVYLVGAPATGKSTLMAQLTADCGRTPIPHPFHRELLTPPVDPGWSAVELGRRRESCPGTDALSMAVQPRVLAWLPTARHRLVLGEGDRLANDGFIRAALDAGYRPHLFMLDAPGDVLDARCAARGSGQAASWRAGRLTKVLRLAQLAVSRGIPVTRLDSRQPPEVLAAQARDVVPLLASLTRGGGGR